MKRDQHNFANNDTNPFTTPQISKHQKPSDKCFVYTLFIIVLLSIALLIAGVVFARIKTPTLRISNVVIKGLYYINNNSSPDSTSATLNMTIASKILLQNMNFGGFEFRGGETTLLYENITIGLGSKIGKGRIGSREKKELNVDFYLIGIENIDNNSTNYELISHNFSRDVSLGMVKMRSFAELRGKVSVVKIMNRHRIAVMNCTMDLNLTSKAIHGLLCL